jgi:autotransporter passenger strand-loop-strand repeat protein
VQYSVSSGQTVSDITLHLGDLLAVASGGIVISTTVDSGGFAAIAGLADSTVVSFGGTVSNTGIMSGSVIYGGQIDGGTIVNTTVDAGGIADVSIASATIVHAGGLLEATSSVDTKVNGGVEASTFANASTITNGGVAMVGLRDTTTADVVSANAIEQVSYGGDALGTTVSSGGRITIGGFTQAGGYASGTTVLSGGTEGIGLGAATGGDLVAGYQSISGGTASGATIQSGGIQIIDSGYYGETIGTRIEQGGGEAALSADAIVFRTRIESGGELATFGGVANATVVESYGTFDVGAPASGTIVERHGIMELPAGSLATATTLDLKGTIDLTSLAWERNGSATLDATTDVLTVVEGSVTSSLQLAGNYTGETFIVTRGSLGTNVAVHLSPTADLTSAALTLGGGRDLLPAIATDATKPVAGGHAAWMNDHPAPSIDTAGVVVAPSHGLDSHLA